MSRPARRRTWVALALGVIAVVVLWIARPLLQRATTSWSAFHDAAPSSAAIAQTLDWSRHPVDDVHRLWNSGRLVTRKQTLDYLLHHAVPGSALWPSTRDVVLDAARCGDIETQESALEILERQDQADGDKLAFGMLQDPDPWVRLDGLLYFQRAHPSDKKLVPVYVGLLADDDARVVSMASTALGPLTGRDMPIKYEAGDTTTRPSIQAGIADWKQWWLKHEAEFPPDASLASAPWTLLPGVKAVDFSLKDLNGKTVRLSDFHGKPVLINFWATWCGACLLEMPDLVKLHHERPDLVILGVAADLDPQEEMDPNADPHFLAEQIRRVAQQHGVDYPVLIDRDSAALAPYGGGDLPVSVLIDPQGHVRRRFIGSRPLPDWQKLIDSLSSSSDAPSKLRG